jgi:hypothetical protein
MSAAFSLGVTLLSNTSATKVTLTEKIETKSYPVADGSFGGANSSDPTFDFSAEGYGTYPYSFATAPNFTAVGTGKVIVETYGTTAKNDDHQQWKVSGKIFPAAA